MTNRVDEFGRMDAATLYRFTNRWLLVDSCWEWQGFINEHGYGKFKVSGGQRYAHRVAYAHYQGLIPEGLVIDHLCANRRCVNPDHLEAVTNEENVKRVERTLKSMCKRGHKLEEPNLYWYDGTRHCKTCALDRSKEKYRVKGA